MQTLRQLVSPTSSYSGLSLKESYATAANDPTSLAQPSDSVLKEFNEAVTQAARGNVPGNVQALLQLVGAATQRLSGGGLDDKELLLEHLVTTLANLGNESVLGKTLGNALITILFNDLPHPPTSLVGHANKYRSADGSGNNLFVPDIGKAGSPYARNVTPITPKPANLPDPGVVFDLLLRRDNFESHPSGISSLLFSFANIIIHDIFWTNGADPTINLHSSYLDLQVVYGRSEAERDGIPATDGQAAVNGIRTHSQGRIFPDAIADPRLVMMTPSSTAIAIMFSRNHNTIAEKLLQINEAGKYGDWETLDDDQKKVQDEEIFQKARLINCGSFTNGILQSYIKTILNQPAEASEWYLNPLTPINNTPRGIGNQVAAEFSLFYRWHSAISFQDEEWMNNLFQSYFPNQSPDEVTGQQFRDKARQVFQSMGSDFTKWQPHGWVRGEDGSFDDAVIAGELQKATKNVAGRFRGKGSPAWLRPVDIMGLLQAREDWNLCTLNEFRSFLGLKTYSSFKEWNSDEKIASSAEALYGFVDNLELFPGLMAEEPKPSMPGSGLCPGYTISRAILSDAASLVRADRFLTTDFSTATLSTYGYNYAQEPQAGSYGSYFGKLLFANFPTQYTQANSVYALFPFNTPETMKKILTKNGDAHKYNFDYPTPQKRWYAANSAQGLSDILTTWNQFSTADCLTRAFNITGRRDSTLALAHNAESTRSVETLVRTVYPPGMGDSIHHFYAENCERLIKSKSFETSATGKTFLVDIVQQVTNVVPALHSAEVFSLPLDTFLKGTTVQELHQGLAAQFAYLYYDFEFQAIKGWALRENAENAGKQLRAAIDARVYSLYSLFKPALSILQIGSDLVGGAKNIKPNPVSEKVYHDLFNKGLSQAQVVDGVQGLMVGQTAIQSALLAQLIHFYLSPNQKTAKDKLVRLVQRSNDPQSGDKLLGYVLEGIRFVGIPILNRQVVRASSFGGVGLNVGDMIYPSSKAAGMDPSLFSDPMEIDCTRDKASYLPLFDGQTRFLMESLFVHSLTASFGAIFKLNNLRLAPGRSGKMHTISTKMPGDTTLESYIDWNGTEVQFPTSLCVMYDSEHSMVNDVAQY